MKQEILVDNKIGNEKNKNNKKKGKKNGSKREKVNNGSMAFKYWSTVFQCGSNAGNRTGQTQSKVGRMLMHV